jgi:hypothetical protein
MVAAGNDNAMKCRHGLAVGMKACAISTVACLMLAKRKEAGHLRGDAHNSMYFSGHS